MSKFCYNYCKRNTRYNFSLDWFLLNHFRNAYDYVYRMETWKSLVKEISKLSARPLVLSSWRNVRHRTPSQPRNPLERRKSTVRLLPSGPDPVPMAKIRSLPSGKPLQSPATPRDRISQLKCGLDSPLGAPPPVVTPPKGD